MVFLFTKTTKWKDQVLWIQQQKNFKFHRWTANIAVSAMTTTLLAWLILLAVVLIEI